MIELSVLIPTYNKKETLKMALRALNCQNYDFDKFEVIIVDDGSTDETVKEVKNLIPKLKFKTSIFSQANQGPAAARNKGIKKAQGEIVLIINDDTIATPNLIKEHLEFHRKHPRLNFGLLGYVTWHPDLAITPFMYWLEHGGPYFSFSQIKGKEAGWEHFWTCNISLKRSFLLKNGLFDEEFPYAAWEDVELGYRLSKKRLRLFYNKNARGYHYHPTTIESIKNKMRANGTSLAWLKEKVPQEFLPPLAKWPGLAIFLDSIFFPQPFFFLLERLGFWAEKRIKAGAIFTLVLLHYRIEGVKKGIKISELMKRYDLLLKEEIGEWKKIEEETLAKGIPWWVDLRRGRLKGKNIFWRVDPRKDSIIRGEEKKRLIRLASREKGRVLDLGCGSGWLSLELARRGMDVVGVDVSPERIKIAKEFLKTNPYKKNFGKIKYITADLNKIDFPKNSFDVIVAWDTLHHFPNLEEILVKGKAWLKPGGRLVTFDHVGNKFLKLGNKILRLFSKEARDSKIIPYEDILGKEIITLLKKNFQTGLLKTRLAFPISALLYLFFSRDVFLPILPLIVRIDRMLCDSGLFFGEYFFFYGIKNEDSHC